MKSTGSMKEELTEIFNCTENILPPMIRKTFHENAYFAGGCFASMANNEEVNDYDIFFKTEESAMIVCGFFLASMRKENITYLDKDKKKFFYGDRYNKGTIFCTHNAITLNILKDNKKFAVQLIYSFYGESSELIKTFDFLHTKCYYLPQIDIIYLNPHAYYRILKYNIDCTRPAFISMKRYIKFTKRGFTDKNSECLANIVSAISSGKKYTKEEIQQEFLLADDYDEDKDEF